MQKQGNIQYWQNPTVLFIPVLIEIRQYEKTHKCQLWNNYLLDAVDPRDKLKGRAGWCVTLDIRLRSTVHCVEHYKTVLRPSILQGQKKQEYSYKQH